MTFSGWLFGPRKPLADFCSLTFESVLKVFIDTAVASAPVSSLNTISWPFISIGAVHDVPFVSWMVSKKAIIATVLFFRKGINCFAETNWAVVTLFLAFMADHLLGWAGLFWMRPFTTVGAFLTTIYWLRSTGRRAKASTINRSLVWLPWCKISMVLSPSGLLRIAYNRFAFSRVSSESIFGSHQSPPQFGHGSAVLWVCQIHSLLLAR